MNEADFAGWRTLEKGVGFAGESATIPLSSPTYTCAMTDTANGQLSVD